jgi:hypothetical protein
MDVTPFRYVRELTERPLVTLTDESIKSSLAVPSAAKPQAETPDPIRTNERTERELLKVTASWT